MPNTAAVIPATAAPTTATRRRGADVAGADDPGRAPGAAAAPVGRSSLLYRAAAAASGTDRSARELLPESPVPGNAERRPSPAGEVPASSCAMVLVELGAGA
ncbi:hypothetical protein MN0502_23220 [Arthrobacter sp. MN05-02]|nr:hypothetical protein MN0502_23220 [Arthrobacter sp. MN05-02]